MCDKISVLVRPVIHGGQAKAPNFGLDDQTGHRLFKRTTNRKNQRN
jgi:hypothetical protein